MAHPPLSAADLSARIASLALPGANLSVRVLDEDIERLSVVRGVIQPLSVSSDAGVMITVMLDHGIGYAADSDLSDAGLQRTLARAHQWAIASQESGLFADVQLPQPPLRALQWQSPELSGWPDRARLLALLQQEAAALKQDPRILSWSASLTVTRSRQWLYWNGECVAAQQFRFIEPNLEATAADGALSQTRSLGGQYNGFCQQGGFEVIERSGMIGGGARVGAEALQLLAAPNCPGGTMDLLLAPDQMMLQIHESIGHPLELDRILGDERNFAGTSFVTPSMFGTYQYGSEHLNVSFDPAIGRQFASYAADDEGQPAQRERLIERGVLMRPLGSALSQARAQARGLSLAGVANARACGWHRPPIDRMGNINVEAGDQSFDQLVASVERGVLMRTNVSWSIDDSRNKFQFGCEWGQLIENGRLAGVVRNPNYRGVSATFWRSLAAVGDESTSEVMGTPFCGKGEPGQVIRVGHAAPACLFRAVDVFGAAH